MVRSSDAADRQGALVDAWLAAQGSANTRNAYRLDLATFGSWCAQRGTMPLRADAAALAAYQLARESEGDSAATLRRRWSSLASFYAFAVANDATSSSPMSGVRRPKVMSGDPSPTAVLDADVVAEYRAMAAELDPRLDALVSLLVVDGVKVGEALALDIADMSGRGARTKLTIRGRGPVRRVTVAADTARALRRCADRRASGPLFVSEGSALKGHGHRLTRFGVDHLLKRLRTASGVGVTANELRRFHITSSHAAQGSLEDARLSAGLADTRSAHRFVARGPTITPQQAPRPNPPRPNPSRQNPSRQNPSRQNPSRQNPSRRRRST